MGGTPGNAAVTVKAWRELAGKPGAEAPLAFARNYLSRAAWTVKWFPSAVDPISEPVLWRGQAFAAGAMKAGVHTLSFPYHHRGPKDLLLDSSPPGQGPGAKDFGMIANAEINLAGGKWRLRTVGDGGVRVLVNGQPVIDSWTAGTGLLNGWGTTSKQRPEWRRSPWSISFARPRMGFSSSSSRLSTEGSWFLVLRFARRKRRTRNEEPGNEEPGTSVYFFQHRPHRAEPALRRPLAHRRAQDLCGALMVHPLAGQFLDERTRRARPCRTSVSDPVAAPRQREGLARAGDPHVEQPALFIHRAFHFGAASRAAALLLRARRDRRAGIPVPSPRAAADEQRHPAALGIIVLVVLFLPQHHVVEKFTQALAFA